jgi:hypothetical protein
VNGTYQEDEWKNTGRIRRSWNSTVQKNIVVEGEAKEYR